MKSPLFQDQRYIVRSLNDRRIWREEAEARAKVRPTYLERCQDALSNSLSRFQQTRLGPLRKVCMHIKRWYAPQNCEHALVQLPLELLLSIMKHLSPMEQIMLSHTCLGLYNDLADIVPDPATQLSPQDRCEYLAYVASTMPDHWVCERCQHLHRRDDADTPRLPRLPQTCPATGAVNRFLHLGRLESYQIHHRHVQMAVKLSRRGSNLDTAQRKYLAKLLTPQLVVYNPGHRAGYVYPEQKATYRGIPTIVDEHWIQTSIWRIRVDVCGLRIEHLGNLAICRHQHIAMYEWANYRPRFRTDGECWENAYPTVPGCSAAHPSWVDRLRQCVYNAYGKPGEESRGSCPFCPTDFSVTLEPGRLPGLENEVVIRAWQDLGSATSPTDTSWRTFPFETTGQHDVGFGARAP